jgi:site-specific DNA-methyltransferase (adenine-specific)
MTVFDPFMGSATTGIACQNTNRNFIGVEMVESNFAIAKKRVEENKKELNAPNLFNSTALS